MSYNTYFGFLAAVILSALVVTLVVIAPGVSADGEDDLEGLPVKSQLNYPNLGSALDQLVASVEEGQATARDAAEGASIFQGGSVAVTIQSVGSCGRGGGLPGG